jgi:hypothetical protein
MYAPGNQRKSNNNQREPAEPNALRGGPMFRVDVVREPELTKPILCRVLSSRNERFGMKLIVRKN